MKVQAYVSVGFIHDRRDEIEIPDEELEGKTGDEREDVISDYVREWAMEHVEWGWTE